MSWLNETAYVKKNLIEDAFNNHYLALIQIGSLGQEEEIVEWQRKVYAPSFLALISHHQQDSEN